MNDKFLTVCLLGTAILLNISACSDVKNYFPDKQKDYRYSAEISALNLPSDLGDNAIDDTVSVEEKSAAAEQEGDPERLQSGIGGRKGRVELVSFAGGATRLLIQEPFSRSWYILGKALSRSAMEVTERNQEEGAYIVQYDPSDREVEDGSIWNDVMFFFGDDLHKDQEFHIRLAENGINSTEVMVLDEKDVPLSKGAGLTLLIVLFDAIKTDIVD